MTNLIVSENKIKVRYYDLIIDGQIVEEMLSSRMANILRDEYRSEGFAVNKVESYTLTNGSDIVGENMVQNADDASASGMPAIGMNTPAATMTKINQDREKMRARNAAILSRKNKNNSIRYTSYGRSKKSTLHKDYVEGIKKFGFRVVEMIDPDVDLYRVWIGFQPEIAKRIFQYVNNGGKMENLNIKYIGSEK